LRQRLRFLIVAAALIAGSPTAPAADRSLEYAVKATFLYKFVPFVDWPPGTFEDAPTPFVICIVGADPFGDASERTIAGQHLGPHPVVLRRLATADARSNCPVMFVAGSPAQPVPEALDAVRGTPTLTITDTVQTGAVIQFVMVDGRVNFDIDAAAASANHLTVSSKLLALAHTVSGGERR
jgi:hypothetical protein